MTDGSTGSSAARYLGAVSLALCVQVLVACGQAGQSGDEPGEALSSATCAVLETLLEDIERGLDQVARGTGGRRPTTGTAVYAKEARDIAPDGALPVALEEALSAIGTEASSNYFFENGAVGFLEQGLIIEAAMPKLCPGSSVPDLRRHAGTIGN
ncbi:hypothetical protein K1X12_14770 [Hyphomonas sp. WL0036]|uniref:hypothetical protein n=1 Tax=Hyphomonas sediminis TaxID=2866160 RepID=UPI001C7FC24C|nr:hypothetical protein [Hyphomonas sediminis]MBY9068172.1 hypothetical protein [Hyphomonas sediminis]